MVVEVNAGDGALAHTDGGAAVAGDEAAEKLKEDGVVADGQHAFAAGVLDEHVLKGFEGRVGGEGGADLNFAVVAELGADELRGLQGALERAGDDDVDLDFEGAQHAGHEHALVFSLFDEASLGVEGGIPTEESGIGVAHEVEDHSELSGGDSCCGRADPGEVILTRL